MNSVLQGFKRCSRGEKRPTPDRSGWAQRLTKEQPGRELAPWPICYGLGIRPALFPPPAFPNAGIFFVGLPDRITIIYDELDGRH